MARTASQSNVPLSHLVPSKRNPRRVKPARDAHRRLVALIRSQGLLQPLVVRPLEGEPGRFALIAGHRRLAALREIHAGDLDHKVPCIVRDVDLQTADALSLGENFGHHGMHPLDEAEAFAKLAAGDGKDPAAIAAEFGVCERYVRQRMKLAGLASVVKSAYRSDAIDTATAEAFAAVPDERQRAVWTELNGHPQHAAHVRNVIAHDWIDAVHALFDVSTLPEFKVSRDLFSERVLIERDAFVSAQSEAFAAERLGLLDEGWREVAAGRYEDLYPLTRSMVEPEREFDPDTARQLEKIAARHAKWEEKAGQLAEDDADGLATVQEKLETLEAEHQEVSREAPPYFSEATKGIGTAFLMLHPDGRVLRDYRIPRTRPVNGSGNGGGGGNGTGGTTGPSPATSDDLADKQLASSFAHETLAVREALLSHGAVRWRLLALILHDGVAAEGLSVRHEANGTTVLASKGEDFASPVFNRLKDQRATFDPLGEGRFVSDVDAYAKLAELSAVQLDRLIDGLIVACLTGHPSRRSGLVRVLADEMKVNVRDTWRPDAAWLAGYRKGQLAHLLAELRGPIYDPARENRKKPELVADLATLFADGAEGRIEDAKLAERVNRWLPANLREADTR
jgi:ParB family chromosome partitioning protein